MTDEELDSAYEELARAIETAAKKASPIVLSAPNDGRASWAHIPEALVGPVRAKLTAIPDVAALEGMHFVGPNRAGGFSHDATSIYLVDRAIHGANADEIAVSLRQIAQTKQSTVVTVQALRGLRLESVIDLGAGLTIEPAEALAKTDAWFWAFASLDDRQLLFTERPTAAIVVRELDRRMIFDGPPSDLPTSPEDPAEILIKRAIQALIVGGGAAPGLDARYVYFDDPGWPHMTGGSMVSVGSGVKPTVTLDIERVTQVAAVMKAMARPAEPVIVRAIERLASARGRSDQVEKVADLGVCLEMLLMHDGSGDNSEITFKIAQRAAWLLGRDAADRSRIFSLVRDAYKLRSAAVHTGSLKEPKSADGWNARAATLRSTEELCAQLIVTLLDGWPDWQTVVLQLHQTAAPRP